MPPGIVPGGILDYDIKMNVSFSWRHTPMNRHIASRLTAAGLALSLLALPAAQALTPKQAAQLLQTYYIDEVPQSVLEQPTIEDMLAALGDPYTEYFTAEDYAAFAATMQDSTLVGVGISYSHTENGLLLGGVMADSPAEAGGLQAGDIIVAVDGQDVLKEPDEDVISDWFKGEVGSKVQVTYLRGGARRTVTLTRNIVVVPATSSDLLAGHIGYIDCDTFGEETYGHFRDAIDAYGAEADVWIVDLRTNLGGATDAAVDSAGLFIGEGDLLYFRDGVGNYEYHPYENDAATDAPVIVLVDQNTASAAEIFTAAIQSYSRGLIIGDRTYGKGVAQTVLTKRSFPRFFADGDALKITSHRFFSPAGNTTDQIGVIPNLLMDERLAADVALLLADSVPEQGDDTLQIDLGGALWQLNLTTAVQETPEALLALLEALPISAGVWLSKGDNNWLDATAVQAGAQVGLEVEAPLFTDHDQSRYAEALSILKTYDMLQGVGDGSYHPANTLTRAELCQILASALNCVIPENPSPYTDVSDDAWYAPAVIAVSNMGLVKGIGHDLFLPEEPIDHQQFITVMGRLAQRLNMFLYEDSAAMPSSALESEALAGYDGWAKSSVWLLAESQEGYFGNSLNLLWDDPANIVSTQPTTRDEAAYLLYRLLTYTEILPPT